MSLAEKTVLVLNAGSSSLKYQLLRGGASVAAGNVTEIGRDAVYKMSLPAKREWDCKAPDHSEALSHIVKELSVHDISVATLTGVGHRVVHGGSSFTCSVLIDDAVESAIEKLIPLAPLHNPANLNGIRAARQLFPGVPQVAVFDTAFHQTMPEDAYTYGLPLEFRDALGVRRYGFHGTSHLYVSRVAAVMMGGDIKDVNLVTLHLGNGSSLCAVRGGLSIDTTMGLTPNEGPLMGTRSGSLDSGVFKYLLDSIPDLTPDGLDEMLNKRSGLLGLSGYSSDRVAIDELAEKEDPDTRCKLARRVETHMIRKNLGSMMASLGRVDGLVFTAGAGENNHGTRSRTIQGLEGRPFGILLDEEANKAAFRPKFPVRISRTDSSIPVWVVPTNEELVIALDTMAIIEGIFSSCQEYVYPFQLPSYWGL